MGNPTRDLSFRHKTKKKTSSSPGGNDDFIQTDLPIDFNIDCNNGTANSCGKSTEEEKYNYAIYLFKMKYNYLS